MSSSLPTNLRRIVAGLCAMLVVSGCLPADTKRSDLLGCMPIVASAEEGSDITFVRASGRAQLSESSIAIGSQTAARAWAAANKAAIREFYAAAGTNYLHICWREKDSDSLHYLDCNSLADFDENKLQITSTSYDIMQNFYDYGDVIYICAEPAVHTDIILSGDGSGSWLNGKSWSSADTANKMTEENDIYTISFANVAAGSHEFRFNAGDTSFGAPTSDPSELGTELSAVEDAANNIGFTLDNPSNVTITFDYNTKKYKIEAEATGKLDISSADVSVDTVNKSVSVTITEGEGSVTVPAEDYSLSFEKKVEDSFIAVEQPGFPSEAGTYKVTAIANDDSKCFSGSTAGKQFTLGENTDDSFGPVTDINDLTADNLAEGTEEQAHEWLANNKETVRSLFEKALNRNSDAFCYICWKNPDGSLGLIYGASTDDIDLGFTTKEADYSELQEDAEIFGSAIFFCGYNGAASAVDTASIMITEAENGTVTASVDGAEATEAEKDKEVTLAILPSDQYKLKNISAKRTLTTEDLAEAIGSAVFTNSNNNCIKVDQGVIKYFMNVNIGDEQILVPYFKAVRTEFDAESGTHSLIFSDGENELIAWIGLGDEDKIVSLDITDEPTYSCENGSDASFPSNEVALLGTGNSRSFTMPAGDVTVTAEFELVKTDLSAAEVIVDTDYGSVSVTIGEGSDAVTVPPEDYIVKFFKDGAEEGISSFPNEPGTYVARVYAKDDSSYYKGSRTSATFILSHIHEWSYSSSGDTITAACSGSGTCAMTDGLQMKISAPENTVYDGTAQKAALSIGQSTAAFPNIPEIEYYKGEDKLDDAPVNVGTYTAKVTYGGTTAQVEFVIAQKPITITAASDTKFYDGQELKADSFTSTAIAVGDSIDSVVVTGSRTDAGSSENVPSATVIRNGAAEDVTANYEITYSNGTLTVEKARITITAEAKSKTFGEKDPELTFTATGLVGSDKLTGALVREKGENAGTYAISQGTLAAGDNYTIEFTGAYLTISPAAVTVTAEAKSKTYGEKDPELTYKAEGLIGTDKLTGALAREKGENAGTYAISQGTLAAGENYAIDFKGADFTIGKAAVTVTAEAKSKTYGEKDPELTCKAEGLVGTDTLTGSLARDNGENAGTYAITQGTLAASDNYVIDFKGADFTIGKADITITADDKSTKYGTDIAELTYQIAGNVKEGDDLGVTVSTEATGTSGAGEYPITVNWNEDPNYTATLKNGRYTITKAGTTVSAADWSGTYDGKGHSISVDAGSSGAIVYYGTEELTADNYAAKGSTDNPSYTDAGSYTVYFCAVSDNYETVCGSKTVSIGKAELTVNADSGSKTYGKPDPDFTYKTDGLIGTDKLTGTLSREQGENVGTYAILQGTLTAGSNYNLSFSGADFTINKAAPTVNAPTPTQLDFDGSAILLVTDGASDGGTLVYALGENADTSPADGWSTEVPSAASEGKFYVWYKTIGDENHTDTEAVCIIVNVAKSTKLRTREAKAVKVSLTDVFSDEYGTLSASWTCGAEPDGFEVLVWNSRSMGYRTMVMKYDAGSETEITIDGLIPFTRCHVMVRAYTVIEGKRVYGRYSASDSVFIKGFYRGYVGSSTPIGSRAPGVVPYFDRRGYAPAPFFNFFGGSSFGRPYMTPTYFRPTMYPFGFRLF